MRTLGNKSVWREGLEERRSVTISLTTSPPQCLSLSEGALVGGKGDNMSRKIHATRNIGIVTLFLLGSTAGCGGPAGSASWQDRETAKKEASAYFLRVQMLIMERAEQSPQFQASPSDWVRVSFTLKRSGEVEDVQVKESSGNKGFDQEAIKIVQEAAPFPPFPQSLNGEQRYIVVPLSLAFE